MRQILFLFPLFFLFIVHPVSAQRKNFTYKFYGFIRGDLYYNNRTNVEAVDGNFYLYPLDKQLDPNGKDLNANPNSNFFAFTSRLGIDITGPNIGSIKTSAKLETDLGGFNLAQYMLRIRHAYVNLAWDKGSALLLGQTWHPLFGDVFPEMLNLSTGSPFQPFSRNAQLRYQYNHQNKLTITVAGVYQQMYMSPGPKGKSKDYLRDGVVPELFAGVNYHNNGFLVGIGVDMLSLKPRTESQMKEQTYKVNERVTAFTYMLQAKYAKDNLNIAAKTFINSNQGHTAMIGGYGVSSIDAVTGKQKYTSSQYSTTWLNIVYGKKWRGGVFAGYTKNLGTPDNLLNTDLYYGTGLNIDQLCAGMIHFSYNLPHWKAGLEYSATTAWYGDERDINLSNGKVGNTHAVTNHRIFALFCYLF